MALPPFASRTPGRGIMGPALTRRHVLAGFGGSVILATVGAPTIARAASEGFDELRLKWFNRLTGLPFDHTDPKYASGLAAVDSGVRANRGRIVRDSDRKQVFTDLRFRDLSDPEDTHPSWVITTTYQRLHAMARGWATPGCQYYQNADILADIVAGLKTAHDYGYNADIPREYDNWWDFEIGAPSAMLNAITLVFDHIEPSDLADYLATVDRFVPDPRFNMQPPYTEPSTGANRADLSLIVGLRGVLGASEAKIVQGREAMGELFAYTTSGDGLYRDGSYIHHDTVAYTGAYGVIMLNRVTDLLGLLAGSPWEFTDDREIFLRTIDHTYAPLIFNNQMMDMVRGRSLSRFGETGHTQAHSVLEKVLVLAESIEDADPERAKRWREMCKGWLERDTYDDMLAGATIPRIAVVSRMLEDSSLKAAPESVGFWMFAGMARAVHRRPGWALGIAMASKRVAYYETGAGENRKGFHTGEGATYLYNDADNGHFEDNYWPTVDLYRVPGTTVNKMPLPDRTGGEWGVATPKEATWVGGVSLDGDYGMVGMDLEGIQRNDLVGKQPPLRARKSWLCADSYVVAVGAGITDVSGYPVETIVENRNLHEDGVNALLLDGETQPLDQGWSTSRKVHWAHVEGVGGYVFPRGGARLSALREERTGSWQDIGSSQSAPITRRFVTLWLDHGVNPVDAQYAYVLMPNATPEATAAMSADPDFQIVANNADAQAVRVPRLGLLGINFFSAGTVANVRASQPCAVLVRQTDDDLVVAVSEPTMLVSKVKVELPRRGYRLVDADPTVYVKVTPSHLVLQVDTSDQDGRTHTARLAR